MKVALVHDHLTQEGGAEKVLEAISEIFPQSPIFTLVYSPEKLGSWIHKKEIRTSFIQGLPFGIKRYKWFLPLMPIATESYDLSDFDAVISSSSALAKGVITPSKTLHICYCHTPTRYLWTESSQYVQELQYNRLLKRIIFLYLTRLRVWDQAAAQRPDRFIANSKTVQNRIKKFYRRQSDIIYPPVDTSMFTISKDIGDYFLIGGRLVAYKRYDIAIYAFKRLNMKLKVFGSGPEYKNLRSIAGSKTEFVGEISDKEKADLYKRCIAFIHPQLEDFGITAVEAMASGRPVIAYRGGGALESIIEGKTGIFFDYQDWAGLSDTVIRFEPDNFDPEFIRKHALKFSKEVFQERIKEYVEKAYLEFRSKE